VYPSGSRLALTTGKSHCPACLVASFNVPMVSCGRDHTAIRRCFVSGYFAHAARLHIDGASYRTVRDAVPVHVHPTSVLFKVLPLPQWVIYHEGTKLRDTAELS